MPDAQGRLQTGVSIVLRDAIPVLEHIHHEFDTTAAARRVPLHVTLLYPFVTRDEISDAHLEHLRSFFASRAPLRLELADIGDFPGVVYARLEPEEELRALMRALWCQFPDTPPYEGAFDDPPPHATLGPVPAGTPHEDFLFRVRERVAQLLPLRCVARDVSLLEEYAPDQWRERTSFPLSAA